ncbi:PREDICTED: annexin [Prunus dulcis]|uniref:PREDICTED: annexin n=1 Tax=Prunus dulcis TaxID=3755 RepID=A0A5E4FTX1_PRUDU|nr:PREDICTED: annexin [Prunus dulcis]
MATLRVPDVVPSPVEDAEQLQKAFEGLLLEFPILLHNQRAVLLWTLVPAERDAFLANEATKRFTSSNKLLLEIATSRSSHDLLLVKQAYHVRYKKSPEEDVAYHTSGDLLKEVTAERDAFLANEATKRFTSSNKLLLEIATSRSSHDMLLVKQAYHVRYKKSLEEDVAYHTSGDLLKRYEGDEISMPLAKKEAKIMRKSQTKPTMMWSSSGSSLPGLLRQTITSLTCIALNKNIIAGSVFLWTRKLSKTLLETMRSFL